VPGAEYSIIKIDRMVGKCLGALVLLAFLVSLTLPKDATAEPLGPGCYWSGLGAHAVSWQHCDAVTVRDRR
jgi:hypothetical protein